jgi:TolB-like protein/predicted negative regulator of RcsB-dependent stress response
MSERNFFAELKRRNVYKVAVAYAVVSWLLIQAASILLPTFDAPGWVMKVLVMVVVLGFVPALIFSWAFEITPEGLKREEEVGSNKSISHHTGRRIVTMTIVLGIIAAALFAFQLLRPKAGANGQASTSVSDKSIAVLPFDNLSHDADNAYFAEGIQDEILTRLAKIAELKVISRTSTQRFKSTPNDLRQIAQQLGVANILEGSVQKVGEQVRVNVQLIKATSDTHLWAEVYDRKLTDIFAVESEIAKTVAGTLQAKLTGAADEVLGSRPTENPEAHQLYLKGRYFWNRRTAENLEKAIACFQQAIEKDPLYALAYTGVADCYGVMPYYIGRPPKEYLERGKAAAQRAIELDDHLAEAHTALANVLMSDLQFSAAEKEFKRSFELNPNYASAHQWYGECLQALGRFDEALAQAQRGRDLDPLALIVDSIVAATLKDVGRTDEALQQTQRILEMDPNFTLVYWMRGQIFEKRGELEKAIPDYEKAKASLPPQSCDALIACVYVRLGRTAEARKILDTLLDDSRRGYVSSYYIAEIQAMLGEKDKALASLEKSYDERSIPVGGGGIGGPKTDYRLDSLRGDPRFQKFLAKFMGESQ